MSIVVPTRNYFFRNKILCLNFFDIMVDILSHVGGSHVNKKIQKRNGTPHCECLLAIMSKKFGHHDIVDFFKKLDK